MDKQKLNNEIILCRPAVRKARVAVIRKVIKNIKILKSCKNELEKPKKLRKAEKLYNKIQIMKKLKDDEVIKFALRHETTDSFTRESSNKKENALASLARHGAVMEKVNAIREKTKNWESELPLLLDSLANKKLSKGLKKKVRKSVQGTKTSKPTEKRTDKVSKIKTKKVVEVKKQVKKGDKLLSNDEFDCESIATKTVESSDGSKVCNNNGGSEKMADVDANAKGKIEKIYDPFFIEKKVIVPKLIYDNRDSDLKGNSEKHRFLKERNNSIFHTKPFKVKTSLNKSFDKKPETESEEIQLHPSWAAKRVKLIKPFEGKKIKFSDD